jgi:hypothetical protein
VVMILLLLGIPSDGIDAGFHITGNPSEEDEDTLYMSSLALAFKVREKSSIHTQFHSFLPLVVHQDDNYYLLRLNHINRTYTLNIHPEGVPYKLLPTSGKISHLTRETQSFDSAFMNPTYSANLLKDNSVFSFDLNNWVDSSPNLLQSAVKDVLSEDGPVDAAFELLEEEEDVIVLTRKDQFCKKKWSKLNDKVDLDFRINFALLFKTILSF